VGRLTLLRLIREPEDLPGGEYQATPDGKGSSIRAMGLFFFLCSAGALAGAETAEGGGSTFSGSQAGRLCHQTSLHPGGRPTWQAP
jgi:hypothetical protein